MSRGPKKPEIFAHTTVIQSRLPLFLPVLRLAPRMRDADIVIENPWGRIKIKKCRLTQIHRDLLDAIFASTRKPVWLEDGALELVFELRDVQRLLGTAHNHTWVTELLDDMLRTVVVIDENNNQRWTTHKGLISQHRYTRNPVPRPPGAPPPPSRPYAVTLSPEFARLWREDLLVHAPTLVPRVLALHHAVNRALVRMILTHRQASFALDDALRHIAAIRDGMSERVVRRIRVKVLSEADTLSGFGIQITAGGTIRYRQIAGVWFKKPTNKTALPVPAAPSVSNDRPFERESLDRVLRGEIVSDNKTIEKIRALETLRRGDA